MANDARSERSIGNAANVLVRTGRRLSHGGGLVAIAVFITAVTTASQTPAPAQTQKLREIKFGETVTDLGTSSARHGYVLTMQAGTSVVCQIGEREAAVAMSVVVPEGALGDIVPDSVDVGRILASAKGVVEPLVIVADKSGKYVIRMIFQGTGKYWLDCGIPHPTTERDTKYALAQKLMLEIRQAIGAGQPLQAVKDKVEARAEVYRSLDDKKSLALSLMDVVRVYAEKGDMAAASTYFRQALQLFRDLNSSSDLLSALGEMARRSASNDNYQEAIDYSNQRLALSRVIGSKIEQADSLLSLGVIYHNLTDESKARATYGQFVETVRSIQPPTFQSLDLENYYYTNMANLVRGMSGAEIPVDGFGPRTSDDFRQAIEYLKQALELNRRMESTYSRTARLHTFNLLQLANSYKELGEYEEALRYLNQFASHPTSASKTQRARVAVPLGSVYAKMGDMAKASQHFDEAIALLREGANPGNHHGYLQNIGRDYLEAGNAHRALEVFQQALTVARSQARPMAAASSLFEIARAERELGNFNNARGNVEEAIRIAEEVRSRITSDELRATYFSTVRRFYEFHTDLLMQNHKAQPEKGFDRTAVETSEKGRSRSLLDLLKISGVEVRQGVAPELLAREQSVRQSISSRASEQTRLVLNRGSKSETDALTREISNLTSEYTSIQNEIRRTSPRYAALTQTTGLSAAQIQKLVDPGTLLLEYSLGEKKSYLWAISRDSIATFDLPGRAEIETDARQAYEQMTARNSPAAGESEESRRARIRNADAEYAKSAATLSEKLLGPAAKLIRNKRLVIVPDGALHYVSFAALPLPAGATDAVAGAPVGTLHEVVSLPSASVLARLREEKGERELAPNMLAIFADPVFSETDARASSGSQSRGQRRKVDLDAPSVSREFERAIADVRPTVGENYVLPRLPFSRREADSIYNVSPHRLSLKRTDFNASKIEVFTSRLDQYRTIHFASHALLNSQHPELSGIVLSLIDKNGGAVDGFLRLHDIYNLNLNADLVVLSACNTALGKEIKGEGVIGLTRGFMYAGSPRVVASLWKVDDAATAALMTVFYRKMQVDNLRPAAALRAAQAEIMKQPRWRSPYFWAPFVLHGEWR